MTAKTIKQVKINSKTESAANQNAGFDKNVMKSSGVAVGEIKTENNKYREK